MIKLGILGSTNGTDLQAIFDAIDSGELNAQVSVVLSNKKSSYILKRAQNNNVPALFVPQKGKTREKFDTEVMGILKSRGVDLVLLIGFMRILSASFCLKWKGRLLNVHPSLLPKHAGGVDTDVHKEVLKSSDIETGCTVHFVTDDIDEGPVLIQKKCNIEAHDTVETLKNKVQKLEGEALVEATQLIQNN